MRLGLSFPRPGSERKLGVVLGKILNNVCEIRKAISGMSQTGFARNRMARNSVILDMATIGELLKTVTGNPDDENVANPDPYNIMKSFPKVPWKELKGFRDIADHNYFIIDANELWSTLRHKLALLDEMIRAIAREYPEISRTIQKTCENIRIFEKSVIENAEETDGARDADEEPEGMKP